MSPLEHVAEGEVLRVLIGLLLEGEDEARAALLVRVRVRLRVGVRVRLRAGVRVRLRVGVGVRVGVRRCAAATISIRASSVATGPT